MLLLPGNLQHIAKLCAKETGRYATFGVMLQVIEFGAGQGYQVLATDGRRLGIVTGPSDGEPGGETQAIVPGDDWVKTLRTLGAKRPVTDADCVAVKMGEKTTEFSRGENRTAVVNAEGRFPNVADLVRTMKPSLIKIEVNAKLLSEILLVAAQFAADQGDRVTLHWCGNGLPVLVTTANEIGQKFQGAIMPLTTSREEQERDKAARANRKAHAGNGMNNKAMQRAVEKGKHEPLPSKAAITEKTEKIMACSRLRTGGWQAAKERHPGMMLLFRLGDFYELFGADAQQAAKAIGLTLTTTSDGLDMAGFPHHSLENHLRTLLAAGFRVAVCDKDGEVQDSPEEVAENMADE